MNKFPAAALAFGAGAVRGTGSRLPGGEAFARACRPRLARGSRQLEPGWRSERKWKWKWSWRCRSKCKFQSASERAREGAQPGARAPLATSFALRPLANARNASKLDPRPRSKSHSHSHWKAFQVNQSAPSEPKRGKLSHGASSRRRSRPLKWLNTQACARANHSSRRAHSGSN